MALTNQFFYTVPEVMEMLRFSKSFTYGLVKDGTIPSVKIGNRILVPKQKFLETFQLVD